MGFVRLVYCCDVKIRDFGGLVQKRCNSSVWAMHLLQKSYVSFALTPDLWRQLFVTCGTGDWFKTSTGTTSEDIYNMFCYFYLWPSSSKNTSVRPSIRLPVCPSVCDLFSQCTSRRILQISGAINIDKSGVHAKGQGQRSKVKVT